MPSILNAPQLEIPFSLRDRDGCVAVHYGVSQDATTAGFDALPGFGLPLALCVGYPLMQAQFVSYAGTGYRTICGWIQIVTRECMPNIAAGQNALHVSRSVDLAPSLQEAGIPFAVFGSLPTMFDAPCRNLGDNATLTWIADTFLVTMPLRSRDEPITRLLGFRWGYREFADALRKPVEILPLVVTDEQVWNSHLDLLRQDFGGWRYGEA